MFENLFAKTLSIKINMKEITLIDYLKKVYY